MYMSVHVCTCERGEGVNHMETARYSDNSFIGVVSSEVSDSRGSPWPQHVGWLQQGKKGSKQKLETGNTLLVFGKDNGKPMSLKLGH